MNASMITIISELQQEQKISWKEVSIRSGVKLNTIYGWRQLRNSPNIDKLESVLSVFGYELEVVLR